MEELTPFSFSRIDSQLELYSSRDNRDSLLQWNLDARFVSFSPCFCSSSHFTTNHSLNLTKFRFIGNFAGHSSLEYERLLKDFFRSGEVLAALGIQGAASSPVVLEATQLGTSVMSMDFFDRLDESSE